MISIGMSDDNNRVIIVASEDATPVLTFYASTGLARIIASQLVQYADLVDQIYEHSEEATP